MLKIGSYNELVVERMVDFGLYLNKKPDEVLLPLKYVPENTRPGDTLRVFVYTDSEDRPVATTLEPKAVVGEFAYLIVKDVASFGAFMDWGLEKDLLVPLNQQQDRMKAGKHYVVKVCLDETTGRVYGTNRITHNCDKNPKDLSEGENVDLLIYGITKIGIMAVVNNRYSGLLYRSEVYASVSIGEKTTGYISRIREDGKIDLTLKSPGYQSISGSGAGILETLKKRGGFIPCHDKSSPDEIRRVFSMSKKEFKKAIGGLYKAGSIRITDKGIQIP
ncbi:MAG: S1-like domain-containing RNA-binding protein [Deltaproteobacteria bacterium]|nr:S1-like domain-containing RNA-binding protein [Deltaproteobacteria bacterium]